MVWVGKDLKGHPDPTPAPGRDTFRQTGGASGTIQAEF